MNEDNLRKLSDYITKMINLGIDEKRIKTAVLSVGWAEEVVKNEMSKINRILEHAQKSSISDMSKIQGNFKQGSQSEIQNNSKITITEPTKPKRIKSKENNKPKEGVGLVVNKPQTLSSLSNKKSPTKVEVFFKPQTLSSLSNKKGGVRMPKKMTKEDAGYLLRDVEPEKCLWINNGPIVGNLEALQQAVKGIKKGTFEYHVNKDKDDFGVWVNEVVGDKSLAKNLSKTKTKATYQKRIKDRVASLKKTASQ